MLKRSRLPLWLGAALGYAEGVEALKSLDALTDSIIYALFVGAVLIIAGKALPD